MADSGASHSGARSICREIPSFCDSFPLGCFFSITSVAIVCRDMEAYHCDICDRGHYADRLCPR